MDIIKSIEHEQLKNKIPDLHVGDTIRVHQRIKEGNRERIQVFEGIIIKKQGGGVNATFTVRRVAYGVGVEKTFLIHSPLVEKIEVVRVGKSRRAKLYYLRDRIGKAAKTKENLGARIETNEIQIKEDLVEEPVAEETVEAPVEETVETTAVEETATAEEVAEEPATEEAAPAEEVVEETPATEETPVEEVAEEQTTEESTPVEEATEETSVEEEKEEPAKENAETDDTAKE